MGKWVPVVANLDHHKIIADYKSGRSVKDIADDVNARDYHIRAVLKRAGIKIIKGRFCVGYEPHNKTTITDDQIMSLVAGGKTFKEAAKTLGCSINIVKQRCYKNGIKSPGFEFEEATNLRSQVGDEAYKLLSDKIWLFNQYVVNHKPSRIIATEIGCGKKAVLSALIRHKIAIRKGPTNRGKFASTTDKCHEFWCDSYWEWKVACELDSDPLVVKFVKNPFPITYIDDSHKTRKYIPDFLVFLNDHTNYLLEVKPTGLLPFVENKTQAGYSSGFKYCVIDVDDKFPWNV